MVQFALFSKIRIATPTPENPHHIKNINIDFNYVEV
jgi:hypothetical protein